MLKSRWREQEKGVLGKERSETRRLRVGRSGETTRSGAAWRRGRLEPLEERAEVPDRATAGSERVGGKSGLGK